METLKITTDGKRPLVYGVVYLFALLTGIVLIILQYKRGNIDWSILLIVSLLPILGKRAFNGFKIIAYPHEIEIYAMDEFSSDLDEISKDCNYIKVLKTKDGVFFVKKNEFKYYQYLDTFYNLLDYAN